MPNSVSAAQGAKYAYENAHALYKVANRVKKAGPKGLACSLFILASEEFAKAISLTDGTPVVSGNDIFRKHRTKHAIGANASSLVHLVALVRGYHRDGCNILDEIECWRARADEIKQRGFYVDWKDNCWLRPQDISDHDLSMAIFTCKTLWGYAKSAMRSDGAP